MSEISKKKAPQKAVLEVERTGQWGAVEYRHRLECGHTDVRKRPAKTDVIACTQCVLAKQMDTVVEQIPKKLTDTQIVSSINLADIVDDSDYIFSGEIDVSRAQSALASHFGVPLDAIDVAAEVDEHGRLKISYATVFIEAIYIYAMINKGS